MSCGENARREATCFTRCFYNKLEGGPRNLESRDVNRKTWKILSFTFLTSITPCVVSAPSLKSPPMDKARRTFKESKGRLLDV
jgi:hypothetical protein